MSADVERGIADIIARHIEVSDETLKAAGGVASIGGIKEAAEAIASRENQLRDALSGLLDWVQEGCPDGGAYAVVEAKAALSNIAALTASPAQGGSGWRTIAFRDFIAQLIVGDAEHPGNVLIREQPIPARVYDAALRASLAAPSPPQPADHVGDEGEKR